MLKSVIWLGKCICIDYICWFRGTWMLFCLPLFLPLEERQKKQRQQKEKNSGEGKTSLQRSKTFVNLFFKKDRKEKSPSKSLSHNADKGEGMVTRHYFYFPGTYSASHTAKYTLRSWLNWHFVSLQLIYLNPWIKSEKSAASQVWNQEKYVASCFRLYFWHLGGYSSSQ